MEKKIILSVNVMGSMTATEIPVTYLSELDEYEFHLRHEEENIRIKFSSGGQVVQTRGTPLDGNTLHDISYQIKKQIF